MRRVEAGREADRELESSHLTENVAAFEQVGHAGLADDRESRSPGSIEEQLDRIVSHWSHSGDPRKFVVDIGSQDARSLADLLDTVFRNVDVEPRGKDASA